MAHDLGVAGLLGKQDFHRRFLRQKTVLRRAEILAFEIEDGEVVITVGELELGARGLSLHRHERDRAVAISGQPLVLGG